eukprot:gene28973-25938_t
MLPSLLLLSCNAKGVAPTELEPEAGDSENAGKCNELSPKECRESAVCKYSKSDKTCSTKAVAPTAAGDVATTTVAATTTTPVGVDGVLLARCNAHAAPQCRADAVCFWEKESKVCNVKLGATVGATTVTTAAAATTSTPSTPASTMTATNSTTAVPTTSTAAAASTTTTAAASTTTPAAAATTSKVAATTTT